ncbi:MAG: flagellin [bacterium]|nr:flagellin [bacterium]
MADWAKKEGILQSVQELKSAVSNLRTFSSELGNNYSIIQTRQNFTESLTDVLETGADNLVLADMNEESANYLALQTRQQLATNALSLAANSAKSVLALFG